MTIFTSWKTIGGMKSHKSINLFWPLSNLKRRLRSSSTPFDFQNWNHTISQVGKCLSEEKLLSRVWEIWIGTQAPCSMGLTQELSHQLIWDLNFLISQYVSILIYMKMVIISTSQGGDVDNIIHTQSLFQCFAHEEFQRVIINYY